MPFLHLPIQSGSNKVLKLMNRKHNVEQYIDVYDKLIKINPNIKFSSDFIVSYPGEERKDFEDTFKFDKENQVYQFFFFYFQPKARNKSW